jgi:NADH-quinone oxidoreductase E subunit
MPLELSADVKARIREIVARYPRRQAALLMVLHLVQDELGHLSIEAQAAVAEALDVPPTLVHEVTTFYEMYHEHPEGQFHLELCTNISCHLQGADALMDHLKKTLGIDVGHQTQDGVFSLMEAECLASCGSGPTMKVGMDYYEYLTPAAVEALIARFKSEAPALEGRHYVCQKTGLHVGPVPGHEPSKGPFVALPTATGTPPPSNGAEEPPKVEKTEEPANAQVATEDNKSEASSPPSLPTFEAPRKKPSGEEAPAKKEDDPKV